MSFVIIQDLMNILFMLKLLELKRHELSENFCSLPFMNHDQGYYNDVKQNLFNSTEFGKRVC
jgi:hypothetical protein